MSGNEFSQKKYLGSLRVNDLINDLLSSSHLRFFILVPRENSNEIDLITTKSLVLGDNKRALCFFRQRLKLFSKKKEYNPVSFKGMVFIKRDTDGENEVCDFFDVVKDEIFDASFLKQFEEDCFEVMDGYFEITTPFLDRHNDHLNIYMKRMENEFVLFDDGYVIAELEILDCRPKDEVLITILEKYGIKNDNGVLSVIATADDFIQKRNNLIKAMLSLLNVCCSSSIENEDFNFKARFLEVGTGDFRKLVKCYGRNVFNRMFLGWDNGDVLEVIHVFDRSKEEDTNDVFIDIFDKPSGFVYLIGKTAITIPSDKILKLLLKCAL